MIINIANEFGNDNAWGGNAAIFTNNYADAVASLRLEVYKVHIMIGAPNCGTSSSTLVNDAAATIYSVDSL